MKARYCVMAAIVVLAMLVCVEMARAHSWYGTECCNNRDCEQLPEDAVTIEEGGYRVRYKAKLGMNVNVLVPFGGVKPSRDQYYHGCANTVSFLCLYVPVNA